jgi:hypothetical protein
VVRAAALLVGVLVVLAGCGSFAGVETAREPFDVETTPPTATSSTNTTQAPVIAFDPLHDTAPDPFVLVNAHYDTLANEPYTVTYRRSLTYANETLIERRNWTTTYHVNRSRYLQDRQSAYRNRSVTRELYANGTHVYSRSRIGDANATVRLIRGPNGVPTAPADALVRAAPSTIRSALVVMNVTGVRSLDATPSGFDEPLFVVTMNRTSVTDPYGDETLNASLTLYVTEGGRIVEFIHTYTFVRNGATIQGFEHVLFHPVENDSIDRPDWATTNATGTV